MGKGRFRDHNTQLRESPTLLHTLRWLSWKTSNVLLVMILQATRIKRPQHEDIHGLSIVRDDAQTLQIMSSSTVSRSPTI